MRVLCFFSILSRVRWVLLSVCYFLMPAPPAINPNLPVNINYVFGMSDAAAQSFMPGPLWFAMLLIGYRYLDDLSRQRSGTFGMRVLEEGTGGAVGDTSA